MAEKKVWDEPLVKRQEWVNKGEELSVVQQCALAGVARATIYALQQPIRLIVSEYND